jgi:hypothetical protein
VKLTQGIPGTVPVPRGELPYERARNEKKEDEPSADAAWQTIGVVVTGDSGTNNTVSSVREAGACGVTMTTVELGLRLPVLSTAVAR